MLLLKFNLCVSLVLVGVNAFTDDSDIGFKYQRNVILDLKITSLVAPLQRDCFHFENEFQGSIMNLEYAVRLICFFLK